MHSKSLRNMKKRFLFLAATAAQEVTKSLRTYVRMSVRIMFFKNALHDYAQDQKGSGEYRQVFLAQGPVNQLFWSCFFSPFCPKRVKASIEGRICISTPVKVEEI